MLRLETRSGLKMVKTEGATVMLLANICIYLQAYVRI